MLVIKWLEPVVAVQSSSPNRGRFTVLVAVVPYVTRTQPRVPRTATVANDNNVHRQRRESKPAASSVSLSILSEGITSASHSVVAAPPTATADVHGGFGRSDEQAIGSAV